MELKSQNEGDLKNKDEPPKKTSPNHMDCYNFYYYQDQSITGAILDEGWEFDQNIPKDFLN